MCYYFRPEEITNLIKKEKINYKNIQKYRKFYGLLINKKGELRTANKDELNNQINKVITKIRFGIKGILHNDN